MKTTDRRRPRKLQLAQDACLVLVPPILFFGILWLYLEDWVPLRWTHAIALFTGW